MHSLLAASVLICSSATNAPAADDWLQFKFDSRHSGNAPNLTVNAPLGLIGAVPLTDGMYTAPVVADGRIFYTSQASGLQLSAVAGAEAKRLKPGWERD